MQTDLTISDDKLLIFSVFINSQFNSVHNTNSPVRNNISCF